MLGTVTSVTALACLASVAQSQTGSGQCCAEMKQATATGIVPFNFRKQTNRAIISGKASQAESRNVFVEKTRKEKDPWLARTTVADREAGQRKRTR